MSGHDGGGFLRIGDPISGAIMANCSSSCVEGMLKGACCEGTWVGNGSNLDGVGSAGRGRSRNGSTSLRWDVKTLLRSFGSWNGRSRL